MKTLFHNTTAIFIHQKLLIQTQKLSYLSWIHLWHIPWIQQLLCPTPAPSWYVPRNSAIVFKKGSHPFHHKVNGELLHRGWTHLTWKHWVEARMDGLILLQVLGQVPTVQRNGKTGSRRGSLRIREWCLHWRGWEERCLGLWSKRVWGGGCGSKVCRWVGCSEGEFVRGR